MHCFRPLTGVSFCKLDRAKLNIMTSNVAAVGTLNAFEQDLTLFRGIERFDCKVKDSDAFVNGTITVTP